MPVEPVIPIEEPNDTARLAGYLVLCVNLVFTVMAGLMAWGLFSSYRADWAGECCDPLEDIWVVWAITGFAALISAGTLAMARFLFTRPGHQQPLGRNAEPLH